jgi:hypothetical protein
VKKIALKLFLFLLLTLLTQIGGVILLFSNSIWHVFNKYIQKSVFKWLVRCVVFFTSYLLSTFFIVPKIASYFGRVALPITKTKALQPLNLFTCLANRHYVKPELRDIIQEVALQMNKKFPATTTNYLDANFPFFDGFSLLPHRSHNDGKKIDLAFFYTMANSGLITNEAPSIIGYGISEAARADEENMPDYCADKGYWQYSLLTKVVSQQNKSLYRFDSIRTAFFLNTLANKKMVDKIFLEPHLVKRMELKNAKFRFHGCAAIRHDDHIHIQIR